MKYDMLEYMLRNKLLTCVLGVTFLCQPVFTPLVSAYTIGEGFSEKEITQIKKDLEKQGFYEDSSTEANQIKEKKEKEDDLFLEKFKSIDAEGNVKEETKEEKKKAKKAAELSAQSLKIPNDGVSLQPQNYKTTRPQVDPSTGALIYKYDFNFPQGVKGLTPEVSLTYNSQNLKDASSFGYGWNITVPYIERMNKSGTDKMYTQNDFVHSDFGEFRNISGNTYGLRVDTGEFLQFTYANNSWVTKDKKGNVYTYGLNASARQDNSADTTKVFRWMLEKIQDVHGNTINYSYYKDSGQIYINDIKYVYQGATPLYRIDFIRTSTPSRKTYTAGFLVENKYVINAVKLYVNNVLAKDHVISYSQPSVTSPFTTISTITETGYAASGNATQTVSFQYSDNTTVAEFATSTTFQVPSDVNRASNGVPNNWVLVDYNNDSLPDIIKCVSPTYGTPFGCSSNGYKYYKNTGTNWVLETTPANPIPGAILHTADQAHFTDINGDRKVDVVVGSTSQSNPNKVYLHQGNGWVLASTTVPMTIGAVDTPYSNFLIYYPSGTWVWSGWRNTDLNNDNLSDYVLLVWNSSMSTTTAKVLYMNDGTGFNQESNNFQNNQNIFLTNNTGGSNNLPNGSYIDSNSDGLTDLMKDFPVNVGEVSMSHNSGNNWLSGFTNNYQPKYLQGNTMHFPVDLNGDGYVDYLYQDNSNGATGYSATNTTASWATKRVYINQHNDTVATSTTGTQFSNLSLGYYPNQVWYPCCNLYQKKPLYIIDVDGDGLNDIIEILTKDTELPVGMTKNVWMNSGKIPGLLKNVTYSSGASFDFMYKSSAQYKDGSNNPLNPDLPFIVQTVQSVTQNDGIGNTEVSLYEYAGGTYYFNGNADKKFAGFEKVTETRQNNSKVVTYYHQGNASNVAISEYNDHVSKLGRVFRTDVLDVVNATEQRTTNKFENTTISTDRYFVYPVQTIVEQDGVAQATTYTFATSTGNLNDKTEWGTVAASSPLVFSDISTDKRSTSYTYLTNTTTNVTVPHNIQIKDQNNTKVSEQVFTYDGGTITKGLPTNIASWTEGATYNNSQKTYSSFGNVATETDPRGKVTTYTYDSYGLLPTIIAKPLSLAKTFTYNYAAQKPTQITDENNRVSAFAYDGFGRIKTESIPNDAVPTNTVVKNTYIYGDIGNASQKVYVQKTINDPTTNYYTLYDGLKREIRNITQVGTNSYTASDKVYGIVSRLVSESLPYTYTGSLTNYTGILAPANLQTAYTYDVLDRVKTATNVLGVTSNTYSGNVTTTTDANGKVKSFTKDGLGRLTQVTENLSGSAYNTYYEWGALDTLTKITDALGNIRNFTYDGEGKRLMAEDLHANGDATFGVYGYSYDTAGNLIQKTTPNGHAVVYAYDDVNRVLTEKLSTDGSPRITYTYDTCANGKTKLCIVTNVNGLNYTYTHTPNGQLQSESVTVPGLSSQTTSFTYDTQQNLKEITHPDTTKTIYTYTHNNLPSSIAWDNGANQNIVNSIAFNQLSTPSSITFNNGTTVTNTFNVGDMYRLTNKTATKSGFPDYQNISYTYDQVGNILSTTDTAHSKTTTYTYDDLHRLLSVYTTGSATSSEAYTYTVLGNLLTRNGASYTYSNTGTTNPHAPTSVASTTLTYDNNGNLLSDGTHTNTWDYNNRVTSSVAGSTTHTYLYNHEGIRVTQTHASTTTYNINKYYVQQGTSTSTKNIYLNNTLVATVDNATPTYVLTDNLGSIETTLDTSGAITSHATYLPYGEVFARTGVQSQRGYIGELYDEGTGLNYLNARYNDPSRGQFISQDPYFWSLPDVVLFDPQLQNSYSYSKNNPINFSDKDGQCGMACVYALYLMSNYIQNSSQSTPNYVREANFAVKNPAAAYKIGSAYDNGTSRSISAVASNFAINLSKGNLGSGESNGIRHVMWQAMISRDLGVGTAINAGNAHENNPFVDLSNRSFNSRESADQTADLLNNQIGRSIYNSNPVGTNIDYARSAIEYMSKNGLYSVSENDNGSFSVIQFKISDSQKNGALESLSELKNGGLKNN